MKIKDRLRPTNEGNARLLYIETGECDICDEKENNIAIFDCLAAANATIHICKKCLEETLERIKEGNMEELIEMWKKEICDKSEEIDPEEELCWKSLFVGFLIGKGIDIETATDYKLYEEKALPMEVGENNDKL